MPSFERLSDIFLKNSHRTCRLPQPYYICSHENYKCNFYCLVVVLAMNRGL